MRGFLAVFERELAERRLLFLLGGAGLFPLAFALVPGISSGAPQDLREASALAVALLASGVLALFLGASVIGGDLAAGRLGFYFARPISASSIWAGKIAAALALSFSIPCLVLLPTLLVDGADLWRWAGREAGLSSSLGLSGPGGLLVWAEMVVALVLAAHALGVLARSRSPFLALDVAGLCAVAGLLSTAGARLFLAGATGSLELLQWALAGAAVAALAAAGLAQVACGRTERRRAHRFLSLTLWALLLTAAMATEAYSRWVVAATPADLTAFHWVAPAPAGSWAAVGGPAAHRSGFAPGFLVDLASHRFVSLSRQGGVSPRFTADGRRAAWLVREDRRDGSPVGVVTADLGLGTSAEVRPVPSRFRFAGMPRGFALSADGTRVAGLVPGPRSMTLVAADLASGRLLAAAPVEDGQLVYSYVFFVGPSRVRIYRQAKEEGQPWGTRILELDLATGRLAPTGGFAAPTWTSLLGLSADLRRLAVALPEGGQQVLDARTGETLLALPGGPRGSLAILLGDRYAELSSEPRGRRSVAIRLLGADGGELRRLPLPSHPFVRLGGQPDAGHLVYATSGDNAIWTSYLLDLATGEARRLGSPLLPLAGDSFGQRPPVDLFWRDGTLVRLDLAHGGEQVVLRPAAAP